jgi:hypothetical protein
LEMKLTETVDALSWKQQWEQTGTFEHYYRTSHTGLVVGARKENIETPTPLLHSHIQDFTNPYCF